MAVGTTFRNLSLSVSFINHGWLECLLQGLRGDYYQDFAKIPGFRFLDYRKYLGFLYGDMVGQVVSGGVDREYCEVGTVSG